MENSLSSPFSHITIQKGSIDPKVYSSNMLKLKDMNEPLRYNCISIYRIKPSFNTQYLPPRLLNADLTNNKQAIKNPRAATPPTARATVFCVLCGPVPDAKSKATTI